MMKTLSVTSNYANINDIKIDILEKKVPVPQQDECLIKVVSSGINPSDALALTGYFKHAVLPRAPGRDFAGTVVEGPAEWAGKKVWGTGGGAGIGSDGTHQAYIKLKLDEMAEVPNNMDVLVAGAQTLPYVTAYYALVERARIEGPAAVLVVGALGQVGRAAMSVLQWKKCRPIALVRGAAQWACAVELGWPAVNAEEEGTIEKIKSAAEGAPISVILNSVGNVYWPVFMAVLAPFGKVVTMGAREGARETKVDLFDLYRANQELIGINTVDLNFAKNATLLNALKPGFESGQLVPLEVDENAIYPLEKAALAFQRALRGTEKRVLLCF